MKFYLEKSVLNQLKSFSESSFFHSNKENLSDYWKLHSKKMSLKFEENSVVVSGESGFYIPKSTSQRIQTLVRNPMKLFKRVLVLCNSFFQRPKYLSWSEGFDLVMSGDPITDPDLSVHRVDHKNIVQKHTETLSNSKEIKEFHSKNFNHPLNVELIVAYYFRNILIPFLKSPKNILEIGGGSGNVASLIIRDHNPANMFMIDLPESIVNAFVHLQSVFPEKKIYLPHEIQNLNLNKINF